MIDKPNPSTRRMCTQSPLPPPVTRHRCCTVCWRPGQLLLTGFVQPEMVPPLLACFHVYVCPSIRETYGISVVQAMSMGLPVLHFGVDGLQDYAEHGVNSYQAAGWSAADMADGLIDVVLNPGVSGSRSGVMSVCRLTLTTGTPQRS
jgi:glycosyltransferase involved in cell wall biosynthesis